ncbi:hypothetical protein BDN71DRAFT_1449783 [Pleurotus eryngii]|uniref:Uncharacterized protein n=1 Tax=Pleurotus eryngii TaxID=5323 RepID=A0A9P5ZUI9_PLEER|nr:hypothetical protein BDN71DRAFT_1449783 [Pleurotus eryngii]
MVQHTESPLLCSNGNKKVKFAPFSYPSLENALTDEGNKTARPFVEILKTDKVIYFPSW